MQMIKRNPKILMIALAMLLGGSCGVLAAGRNHSPVMPPNSDPYGMSYAEWSAAWWQWALSLPADQSPMFDETGCANGANGQSGPVWFLTGVINVSGTAVRTCTVPPGKAIFFPVLNSECSTIEAPPWYGSNEAELCGCATTWQNATAGLACEIDGVPVENLDQYRVQSPMFEFTVPDNNILGVPAGSGNSVSDGVFLMVPPMSVGEHTIHFKGTLTTWDFTLDITYYLTVGR